MKRRLNGKFLLILLIATALAGGGVYGLHKVQVRRNAGSLLRQAERAEAEGDLAKASEHLERYLGLAPDDTEALIKFGRILDQRGEAPDAKPDLRMRALLVMEQALGREPDHDDLRRRVARLAVDLGQFSDAHDHLEILLNSTPDDGMLQFLLGRSEEARGRDREAASWYEKAIKNNPQGIDGYVRLASLLRSQLKDPDRAAQVMDALVTANGKNAQAYVERARDRIAREKPDLAGATSDAAEARALAPDEADALLISARVELAKVDANLATARGYLKQGIGHHPERAEFYQVLADLEMRASQPEQALAALIRGAKALPEHLDLQGALAHLMLQQGKQTEARAQIASLREAGYPKEVVDYLDAFDNLLEGKWAAAARKLDDVIPRLVAMPALAERALLLLGRCHEKLGNPDQQYAAFRRAAAANPLSAGAHVGMGAALVAMDRLDEALAAYRRAATGLPGAAVDVARLQLLRTLRLPEDQRRWPEVDQALDAAAQAAPDSVDLPILRAQALAARGETDRAREVLTTARDGRPDHVEFWVALAEFQEMPEASLAVLDQAAKRLGGRFALHLARIRHWSRHGGEAAPAALDDLEAGIGRFSTEEQGLLLKALADAHLGQGRSEQAEKLYRRSARLQPGDLGIRLLLFDLALRRDDRGAVRDALDEIRRIEGPEGTLWRYGQAAALIDQVARQQKQPLSVADQGLLSEARVLLAEISARRPDWSRVPLAEAEIDDLLGNQEAAIKSYLRAIDLGDRSPTALRRVVELLHARRRFDEAAEVLAKLRDRSPLPGDTGLLRVMAEVALRTQDGERALELARKAVSEDSKDYRDQIWLGQVLWATDRKTEAEAALRRATELAPDQPGPWEALVGYLAATERKPEALVAIQEARSKIPEAQAPLALARCYEAVADTDQAQQMYLAALAASPGDADALRAIIGFYLRSGQVSEAEPHLRKLARSPTPEDAAWATRVLTYALAIGGDPQRSREALELAGLANGGGSDPRRLGDEPAETLRTRAGVLALQKNRHGRQEAIGLLEELDRRGEATDDDRFLLAQLYEIVGDWPHARDQMLNLLSREGTNPRYLAHYASSLLRRGDFAQAQPWVAQLEQAAPQAPATIELKARLFQAQGRGPEATEVLLAYAREHDDQRGRIAALLEDLDQFEAAEALYRQLASISGKPEGALALAGFLGRRGRLEKALELCEGAWKTCPPREVANTCLAVLNATTPGEEHYRRVSDWLKAAAQRDSGSAPALLVPSALLLSFQGRLSEAEASYRKAIEHDSRDIVALNNLAWLLAIKLGKATEAERWIDQAIGIVGPLPALRDTRGVIYLTLGRTNAAISDLEESVAEEPTAATYFHLAQAYHRSDQPNRAAEALQKAKNLGLDARSLDPFERGDYEKTLGELARR